ncbi:MAG: Acyl-CoA dehydrogenase, partial [Modestobacter sp.]|nr:Acyl-CoA dehydrogenase [Modestobacter sp.]
NETRRFFTMLGTLVRGRVSVGGSAGSATKLALEIAVRYGDTRRQFAAPGEPREIVVND